MERDIQELKADVKELVRQGAIHNELLRTHESRSTTLQSMHDKLAERVAPLEKRAFVADSLAKAFGAITVGALIQWIVRTFI